jgi:DNA mismatch repair protein MutS
LQVAQLAGVPQTVIRAARKHLAMLEAQSVQSTPQFDLFNQAAPPQAVTESESLASPSAVDGAVTAIDPDTLTPREALELLYRLKELSNQQKE